MSLKDSFRNIFKSGKETVAIAADEYFSVLLESDVNYETAEYIREEFMKSFNGLKFAEREQYMSSMKKSCPVSWKKQFHPWTYSR